MSTLYMTKEQLESLTDAELKQYSDAMVEAQLAILEAIDIWGDNYNLISDEYDRRAKRTKLVLVHVSNETKH